MTTLEILSEVAAERERQEAEWGDRLHPDGTSIDFLVLADQAKTRLDQAKLQGKPVTWQMILDEEILEAFSETDQVRLRAELIQVAGVAVAWIEDLDRPGDPADYWKRIQTPGCGETHVQRS